MVQQLLSSKRVHFTLSVHTDSEEEQANINFVKATASYPSPLVLNVEERPNTLRFPEPVITIAADRLSCHLRNSVARNPGSGDTELTRLPKMSGGTNRIGRLSWLCGGIHRLIVEGWLSILEMRLEVVVSG